MGRRPGLQERRLCRVFCAMPLLVVILLTMFTLRSQRLESQFHFVDSACLANRNAADEVYGPIDLVFTWVNGTDPEFIESMLNSGGYRTMMPRFRDYSTLRYALRSVEMFAPWIGHVYIVTNGQVPDWLDTNYQRVSIVTHEQIFEDKKDLPTFNSHTIESHLHAIPGLNERFVYCNDDMMFGREMSKDDFWVDPDTVVQYYENRLIPGPEETPRNIWKRALQNVNAMLNAEPDIPEEPQRRFVGHHCYPFLKSVLRETSIRFRDEYVRTRRRKFRHADDITIPFLYGSYLPHSSRKWTEKRSDFMYAEICNDVPKIMERFDLMNRRRAKFLCFNDAFHDEPQPEALAATYDFFEQYWPVKSGFEK